MIRLKYIFQFSIKIATIATIGYILPVAITAAVSTQLFSLAHDSILSVKNEIITRNNQKFMKLMWQEK